jgi:hypothetical protein
MRLEIYMILKYLHAEENILTWDYYSLTGTDSYGSCRFSELQGFKVLNSVMIRSGSFIFRNRNGRYG